MKSTCFVAQDVSNGCPCTPVCSLSVLSPGPPSVAARLARGFWPRPPSLSVPCNRLWRLNCASRSSSSTLGGLPEERNTFTGCRHDDLEWAVAVACPRPELAAAREGDRQ